MDKPKLLNLLNPLIRHCSYNSNWLTSTKKSKGLIRGKNLQFKDSDSSPKLFFGLSCFNKTNYLFIL